jgi:hypothetical protein
MRAAEETAKESGGEPMAIRPWKRSALEITVLSRLFSTIYLVTADRPYSLLAFICSSSKSSLLSVSADS